MGDKKKRRCSVCLSDINLVTDKYVILKTHNGEKVTEDLIYHFECWKHYFKRCVSNKVGEMQSKAMGLVKNMIAGVGRGGEGKIPGM